MSLCHPKDSWLHEDLGLHAWLLDDSMLELKPKLLFLLLHFSIPKQISAQNTGTRDSALARFGSCML